MKTCHLAIDIGASSGRHIVGWTEDGVMKLKETYRFENGLIEKNGHLCWDIEGLVTNVIAGIAATKSAGFEPAAIGIDTWAVDFVLLDENKKLIGDAVAYRDSRTDGIREKLEKEASGGGGITFAEQYARSGIQYQKFNTCYQLAALSEEHPEQLAAARYFLMIPDYLNYRLTGVIANEYTNASTTALVSAKTCGWAEVRAVFLERSGCQAQFSVSSCLRLCRRRALGAQSFFPQRTTRDLRFCRFRPATTRQCSFLQGRGA